jgi:L-malate glycosyltransferase
MKPKPNILQLIDSFQQGGTERQAVQLTRLLHASGRYRVHVACLNSNGPLRGEVEALQLGEIPEFPLKSFYDANAFKQLRSFSQVLRRREIDLIHVHDFYTNIFGMAAAALARVPVRIASRRETDPSRSFSQRFIERRAYNVAHAVVANAEAIREQLISEGVPARKVVTVYNGIDIERVASGHPISRAEALSAVGLPTDEGRRFVTIIANMRKPPGGPAPYKDQQTFLRAAQLVNAAVPDAVFVLAGEGELQEELRALAAELGISAVTIFLGRCSRVRELLSVSDVCVLSSKSTEGFSNSIIEYMAAARPVVATDVGGAREQIVDGETGYIVAPGDSSTMGARIIELLQNPARAQTMGQSGYERVRQMFSCEAQLARTEALYQKELAAHGVPFTRPARTGENVIVGD